MKRHLRCLTLLALLAGPACSPDAQPLTGPDNAGSAELEVGRRPRLAVMSRNLYVGADVDAVIAAQASPDPNDDFPTLLQAISVLQETAFPTRAEALAREVARYQPHVIGLQEVTDLDIDLTGIGIPVSISLDFLAILQDQLARRGLNYVVAAQVTNIQAAPFPGISVIDRDVILIDASRVTLGSFKIEQNFSNNIGVVAPGVTIKRGWVAVEAIVGGRNYVIANTHLESGSAPGLDQLRAAQVLELVTTLGTAAPAVVLGDLNDVPGSLMHQVMVGAGFADTWAALRPGTEGYTCCHQSNLANQVHGFTQRIDFVFTRGLGPTSDWVRGKVDRVGETPSDRIAGPDHRIWPSDHAGLVASLVVPWQSEE
jgi:endonuclease/exonuclease/phosphatase family metal-dependent hydrolase